MFEQRKDVKGSDTWPLKLGRGRWLRGGVDWKCMRGK